MTKPLRADATRNREKLLDAALEQFAQCGGTGASLEAVAKCAGVGIGTLYRHFPTRDALVEAAYRTEVAHLCDAASELLASSPPDVVASQTSRRRASGTTPSRYMLPRQPSNPAISAPTTCPPFTATSSASGSLSSSAPTTVSSSGVVAAGLRAAAHTASTPGMSSRRPVRISTSTRATLASAH